LEELVHVYDRIPRLLIIVRRVTAHGVGLLRLPKRIFKKRAMGEIFEFQLG
jgi:hypothetical protein